MATSTQLRQAILDGQWDEQLRRLYGREDAVLARQKLRYAAALEQFERYYGPGRQVRIYSAPGRAELGGNHTDHQHGYGLAAAVTLDTRAAVAKNADRRIRIQSEGYPLCEIALNDLTVRPEEINTTAALVRGVAARFQQLGCKVGGFDAYTTSNVLRGSGLSSSAAFEVCIGAILRGEYNDNDMEKFSQVKIAQIGQYAENVFFGKPCGLMDQTACAVGGVITIDFKDPSNPVVGQTAIDLAKRKGEKWWMLLLFSIVSIALGALLIWHPFGAAVSVVMLCGILLIVEGALNLGCILYAAMELRTLDRMANAAVNATLTALGDALDEAEAAGTDIVDVTRDGEPVVYDAESTDVSDEDSSKT